jgi:hypothetical protein
MNDGSMVFTENQAVGADTRENISIRGSTLTFCAGVGFDETGGIHAPSSHRSWHADDRGKAEGYNTVLPTRQFVASTGESDNGWLLLTVIRKAMKRGAATEPDFRVSVVKLRGADAAAGDATSRLREHDGATYAYQGDGSKTWQLLTAGDPASGLNTTVVGFKLEVSSVYVVIVMPLVRAVSANGAIGEVAGFEVHAAISKGGVWTPPARIPKVRVLNISCNASAFH